MDSQDRLNNTAPNPQIDLLHNTGSTVQLQNSSTAGGPYGAGAVTPKGVQPVGAPPRQPAAFMAAASAQQQKAPTPSAVAANPMPIPRAAPPMPLPPRARSSRRGIVIVLGVLVLLAAIGAAIWWFLLREEPTSPAPVIAISVIEPTELTLTDTDTSTAIEPGGSTKAKKLTFSFTLATKANSGSIIPEIEVRPLAEPFTGKATLSGQEVSANGRSLVVSLAVDTLVDGEYHWQARSTIGDEHSEWSTVSSQVAKPDFVIDTVVPAAPAVTTVGDQSVKPGQTISIKEARPTFSGTAEPNSKISLTIGADIATLSATADAAGKWQAVPTSDIPSASHATIVTASDAAGNESSPASLTLVVSGATAAATPPAPPPAAAPPPPTPAPPASAPPPPPLPSTGAADDTTATRLADTGDETSQVTIMCFSLILAGFGGLVLIRRRRFNA